MPSDMFGTFAFSHPCVTGAGNVGAGIASLNRRRRPRWCFRCVEGGARGRVAWHPPDGPDRLRPCLCRLRRIPVA